MKVLINIFICVQAILNLILVPLFIFTTIPIWTFRYIVAKAAKCVRPDLGQIVSARGSIMSGDSFYHEPNHTVVGRLILRDPVDINNARQTIWQNVLEAKLENGDIKYPELKSYLKPWMGYLFWAPDPDFRLENQVKEVKVDKQNSDGDILKLQHELLVSGWVRKRPLWEMVFVPNCVIDGSPTTVLFIRIHHIMADGYAMQFLILKHLCNQAVRSAQPAISKYSATQKICRCLLFPFAAALALGQDAATLLPNVPFNPPRSGTGVTILAETSRISKNVMYEIKTRHGVTMTAVVNAMLAGAVREFFISKGMAVPKEMPGNVALPFPDRPSEKLRNYVTGGILRYPTGEPDAGKRLKRINENYRKLKRSPLPTLTALIIPVLGSYPIWIIKFLGRFAGGPLHLANLSCGFETMFFAGQSVEDAMLCCGMKACGLGVVASSYVDGFRFSLTSDDNTMTQMDLDVIAGFILRQVDLLLEL